MRKLGFIVVLSILALPLVGIDDAYGKGRPSPPPCEPEACQQYCEDTYGAGAITGVCSGPYCGCII